MPNGNNICYHHMLTFSATFSLFSAITILEEERDWFRKIEQNEYIHLLSLYPPYELDELIDVTICIYILRWRRVG